MASSVGVGIVKSEDRSNYDGHFVIARLENLVVLVHTLTPTVDAAASSGMTPLTGRLEYDE